MLSRRPLVAFFASCFVLASGCGGENGSREGAAEVWSVDSAPALSIGLSDAENLDATFERITGATRLPDGRLLVGDLGSWPLKLFTADGRFERHVTRKGQGPKEIEYLARLFRCGDAVYTHDIDGWRVLQWSLNGEHQREFRFVVPATQQAPYASACNASGRFVHLGWRTSGHGQPEYHRDTVPAWITAAPDSSPTVIGDVAGSERWGRVMEGQVVGSRPLPFGKQPVLGISATRIYIATGDVAGVRVLDLNGDSLGRIALADSAPPVTPDDIKAIIENEILQDGESRRRAIEREYGEITYPTTKSNVSALIVDSDGFVWIQPPARASASSVNWQVFDADGLLRATITMPSALEVYEIGTDYVLGRRVDGEAGVPLLELYGLRRVETR